MVVANSVPDTQVPRHPSDGGVFHQIACQAMIVCSTVAHLEPTIELPEPAAFWHGHRVDRTLDWLWSLGIGNSVALTTLAEKLEMDEESCFLWLYNHGRAYWEPIREGQRWKPLTSPPLRVVDLSSQPI